MTDYTRVTPKRRSSDGYWSRRSHPGTPKTERETVHTTRTMYQFPDMGQALPRASPLESARKTPPDTKYYYTRRKSPDGQYMRTEAVTPTHPYGKRSTRHYVPPRAPTPPSPPDGPPRSAWPPPMERPAGFRTPSPTEYTEDEADEPKAGDRVKLSKVDLLKLLRYHSIAHEDLKTRLDGLSNVVLRAYSHMARFIHESSPRLRWHKATRSSILVLETMEMDDYEVDDFQRCRAVYTGAMFSIAAVEHFEFNVTVPTACLYWSCALYGANDGDNGRMMLVTLLGQIVCSPYYRYADMQMSIRGKRDGNLEFEQLKAMVEATLETLLERVPVVIVIDSVQSWEANLPGNRNVRAALAILAGIAERDGEKHPLKVSISSAKGFEPLAEGRGITGVVRVPGKVRQEAWDLAEKRK